jgi:hypothetical protein
MHINHLLLHLILILTHHPLTITAQVVTDDTPKFSTMAGFADLRECAQCPLKPDFMRCRRDDFIPSVVGCGTNKCLCEQSHQDEAIRIYGQNVMELCNSNTNDRDMATSFLVNYCNEVGPTPTGECTVTVTTTAEVTVTVSAAVSRSAPARLWYTVPSLVAVGFSSGLCFFWGQWLIGWVGR